MATCLCIPNGIVYLLRGASRLANVTDHLTSHIYLFIDFHFMAMIRHFCIFTKHIFNANDWWQQQQKKIVDDNETIAMMTWMRTFIDAGGFLHVVFLFCLHRHYIMLWRNTQNKTNEAAYRCYYYFLRRSPSPCHALLAVITNHRRQLPSSITVACTNIIMTINVNSDH